MAKNFKFYTDLRPKYMMTITFMSRSKLGVRLIRGCVLYLGDYDSLKREKVAAKKEEAKQHASRKEDA